MNSITKLQSKFAKTICSGKASAKIGFTLYRPYCASPNKIHSNDNGVSIIGDNSSVLKKENAEYSYARPDFCDASADQNISLLKRIKYEYEIWKYADAQMPDFVDEYHFQILSKLNIRERLQYLTLMGIKQRSKLADFEDKLVRQKNFHETRDEIKTQRANAEHIFYGFGGNFIFQRLEKQIFHNWGAARLALAAQIQKFTIIHDFSLLHHCSVIDQQFTLKNTQEAFLRNLEHRQPCNLIYTGVDKNAFWYKQYVGAMYLPSGMEDYFLYKCTEKHYTDLYPVDKLVYLSPDAREMLTNLNEDIVYIVGAINDNKQRLPSLTLGEAKRQGIRVARLPLDRYLSWGRGTKSFNVSQVQSMLLDYFMTNDWKYAFFNNTKAWNLDKSKTKSMEIRIKIAELVEYKQNRERFLMSLVAKDNECVDLK